MTGCPFALPFIQVEQNVPPSIIHSNPPADQDLVMQLPQYPAFVVVTDDDTDLNYVWSIDHFGAQGGATPLTGGAMGSQITLTRNDGYNGQHLTVFVFDPAGASDEQSWKIVIPENTQ